MGWTWQWCDVKLWSYMRGSDSGHQRPGIWGLQQHWGLVQGLFSSLYPVKLSLEITCQPIRRTSRVPFSWSCRMMLYLPSLTLASDDSSVHTWVSLGQTAMASPKMLGVCVFFASTVLLPGQAGENASYFAVSTAIQGAHLRALPLWHMASNWTHVAYACPFYNPL